jgi:hypothetical protein
LNEDFINISFKAVVLEVILILNGNNELGATILEGIVESVEVVSVKLGEFILVDTVLKGGKDSFINTGGRESESNSEKEKGLFSLLGHSFVLEGLRVELLIFVNAGSDEFEELDSLRVLLAH